jgi:hypothetical protein
VVDLSRHCTQPVGTLEPGASWRRLVGETPTSLRTLLRVKAVNDASRDVVPSETPHDGRQSTTASSGEGVTSVAVQLDVHGKTAALFVIHLR